MSGGVFFDLYGTLFLYGDMETAWKEIMKELHLRLCEYGFSISQALFIKNQKNFPEVDFNTMDKGLTVFENQILKVCSERNINMPISVVKETAASILNVWDKYTEIDPDCAPVLEAMKTNGKTIGLISNFDHPPHVRFQLKKNGIERFFSTVVISGEFGFKKPDRRIFQEALRRTGIKSQDAVYFGDSLEDIVGGNNAGFTTILVDRTGQGKNFGQKYTIKSLNQAQDYV